MLYELLLCLLLLAVGLAVGVYLYLTWHFQHWKKRGIPGPKPLALYGTFPGTIDGKRNFIYDLDEVYRQFKGRAKFVGVFTTRNPQLLILDPELVKEILITNFKCFQDNESCDWMDREKEPISGSNPFVLPAEQWKAKRADIVPGLTMIRTKGMYPIITNITAKLRRYLAQQLEDNPKTVFDAKEFSLRYTGEVVADVVWGIEAGTFNTLPTNPTTGENKNDEAADCTFLHMSKRMIAQTFAAFTYYFIIGIFPFLRRFFYVRFFPVETDRYFLQLTKEVADIRRVTGAAQRQDFLQHLLDVQQKKEQTYEQVLASMLTFHFDGFETSATLISHCLLLLARHPVSQRKLRAEISEALDKTETGEMTFDELRRLPYLEQCVAETLRIFTPLPFMGKVCTAPCTLENTDGARVDVKPGDICLISLHSFHHDEDYFAQPESFWPERFAEERGGTARYKERGVYLPFGDGPRICLGMNFGLMQAKAAIVEVIKHFEIRVNERTRDDNWQGASGFIMGLAGGIHLNMKPI